MWTEETLRLGDLELKLVPAIGGRLMDAVYKGTSLLFQNPDLVTHLPDLMRLDQLPSRAPHIPFPLWGGEKTWIAPESDWPNGAPYAVLDSGAYTFSRDNNHSATMVSPTCPETGLQIKRVVTLSGADKWTIGHQVTNRGEVSRSVGLWSVSMTQSPASYFFRSQPGQSPRTLFGNPDNAVSFKEGIGQVACDSMREFKIGAHPTAGLAAARIPTEAGTFWLISRTDTPEETDNYAHGHALEFYNSGHYNYGELEWHSPMTNLQPGQSHSFELSHQVIMEKPNQTALEAYLCIESDQGLDQ